MSNGKELISGKFQRDSLKREDIRHLRGGSANTMPLRSTQQRADHVLPKRISTTGKMPPASYRYMDHRALRLQVWKIPVIRPNGSHTEEQSIRTRSSHQKLSYIQVVVNSNARTLSSYRRTQNHLA